MPARLPSWLKRAFDVASACGLDVYRAHSLRHLPRFVIEARAYQREARDGAFTIHGRDLSPILTDYTTEAGVASGDYFVQDLWAARRIYERQPARHVDVGSRVDGFVAHVLTFMPVTVVDIRPLTSAVEGLTFVQADARDLSAFADGSVESLSSLHAVEHIGLGRYGDAVDAAGWKTAIRELVRVLAPGGRLYFSVPVGRERVEFNSQRVFAPSTIIEAFQPLPLAAFACVPVDGMLHRDLTPDEAGRLEYACGLFEFGRR